MFFDGCVVGNLLLMTLRLIFELACCLYREEHYAHWARRRLCPAGHTTVQRKLLSADARPQTDTPLQGVQFSSIMRFFSIGRWRTARWLQACIAEETWHRWCAEKSTKMLMRNRDSRIYCDSYCMDKLIIWYRDKQGHDVAAWHIYTTDDSIVIANHQFVSSYSINNGFICLSEIRDKFSLPHYCTSFQHAMPINFWFAEKFYFTCGS